MTFLLNTHYTGTATRCCLFRFSRVLCTIYLATHGIGKTPCRNKYTKIIQSNVLNECKFSQHDVWMPLLWIQPWKLFIAGLRGSTFTMLANRVDFSEVSLSSLQSLQFHSSQLHSWLNCIVLTKKGVVKTPVDTHAQSTTFRIPKRSALLTFK